MYAKCKANVTANSWFVSAKILEAVSLALFHDDDDDDDDDDYYHYYYYYLFIYYFFYV